MDEWRNGWMDEWEKNTCQKIQMILWERIDGCTLEWYEVAAMEGL